MQLCAKRLNFGHKIQGQKQANRLENHGGSQLDNAPMKDVNQERDKWEGEMAQN